MKERMKSEERALSGMSEMKLRRRIQFWDFDTKPRCSCFETEQIKQNKFLRIQVRENKAPSILSDSLLSCMYIHRQFKSNFNSYVNHILRK